MKLIPIRNKPNLYRHPKTKIIYFRMFRKGLGDCERSTGEIVLSRAEVKAEKIRSQFLGEEFLKKATLRRLFADDWREFLEANKNKSPATYSSIEIQGRVHILPFFGDKFAHEINETLWEQFVNHSKKLNYSRRLFNDWKYLKMALNFLHRNERLKRVPKLRNPDPKVKSGRVYSQDEIDRLLKSASEDLKLQILMAITMGMRLSEILLLTWERVDFETATIHLRAQDTKIRKSRTFGISRPVFSLLLARYKKTVGEVYVFPSPANKNRPVGRQGNKTAWRACKRRAKVRGRFHDLRHTFMTRAFKKPINPALICEYAGLSMAEAQRTYLHFDAEDTRVVSTLSEVDDE